MITNTPILFLIFNRPRETKTVFDAIRRARPKYLFVAADGPRKDISGEQQKCMKVRAVTEKIDWPCKVTRLYRDKNLGCKMAVSEAINWFFKNVREGIILEDDCLPNTSFFKFCEEMLAKYRNNSRIGIISGNNFLKKYVIDDSYYFSFYLHMWGWATWRRVWRNYDLKMDKWPKFKRNNWLNKLFTDNATIRYWKNNFDKTYLGEINTWDYQWVFASWNNGYLNVSPKYNLVTNIGFGKNATHLRNSKNKPIFNTRNLQFPLKHPLGIKQNILADNLEEKDLYRKQRIILFLKDVLFINDL